MEQERVLKRVLFTIVVLDHINRLEWTRIVSSKPDETLEKIPGVFFKTFNDGWHCLSLMQWIMRFDNLSTEEEVKVQFLT